MTSIYDWQKRCIGGQVQMNLCWYHCGCWFDACFFSPQVMTGWSSIASIVEFWVSFIAVFFLAYIQNIFWLDLCEIFMQKITVSLRNLCKHVFLTFFYSMRLAQTIRSRISPQNGVDFHLPFHCLKFINHILKDALRKPAEKYAAGVPV